MKKLFGILFIALITMIGGLAMAQAPIEERSFNADGTRATSQPSTDTGGTQGIGGTTVTQGTAGIGGRTTGNQLVNTQITNPIKYNNFYDFVEAVLKVAVQILMPFVVLAFVYSGFLFVRAQGAPAELESAKKAIFWSVIGAFILLGAWAFAKIIGTTVTALTP